MEKLSVEVDGEQHFREAKFHYTQKDFIDAMNRDMFKDKYHIENGFSIVRIPYNLSEQTTKDLIIQAISLCQQGYQLYFSYQHYYNELIKIMN
jgi:very-short-patch-repair endonuclease